MSGLSEKIQLLLALHKKIYKLNCEVGGLSREGAIEAYQIIRKLKVGTTSEEKDYLHSIIDDADWKMAETTYNRCTDEGIRIVTIFDDDYPCGHFSWGPAIFFAKGIFPDQQANPYLAFVGARKASNYGREIVKKLVGGLREYDVTIVSGLAHGIDGASHEAALEEGLHTVAVMGCGIDYDYPAAHRKLKEEIVKSGAIISEFPLGTPPLKHNFPMRNRIISGLSRGVVVVEARILSGSLITAKWAADQGKPVFAVPGNVGRPMSTGTNLLIKEGAIFTESAQDIFEPLKLKNRIKTKSFEKFTGQDPPYNDIKRTIYEIISGGDYSLDELADVTGLKVSELLPIVTEVELIKN